MNTKKKKKFQKMKNSTKNKYPLALGREPSNIISTDTPITKDCRLAAGCI